MKLILTLIAGMTFLTAAPAALIHVSPSGSDTNNGSLATPFQTIAKALATAQPGDSVELHAGTYRESINPPISGTALSPITIENYSNDTVVVSACNVVPGPWTAGSNGIYTATAPGSLPVTFWGSAPNTANGSKYIVTARHLVGTVVNEGASTTVTMTSAYASSAWNFFANAVTWQVGGLSIITNSGAVPMPPANAAVWFSIKSPLTNSANGYSADDAALVTFNGTGKITLNLKKNAPNSMGTQVYTITDPNINGYALTLGPASGANVPYQFIVKRSTGVNTTNSGNWAILQSDWSDGGTGTASYVDVFAQETATPTPNLNQQFSFTVGSYTITSGTNAILNDTFSDVSVALVDYFSGATNSPISSGYNQVFVDGIMQQEARFPDYGAGDVLHPATANVIVTNGTASSNPNTITATNFGGRTANFFTNAVFCGGVGSAWSWQNAVVTNSSGNTLTVNPATKSTWWWPDYDGVSNNNDTGRGFVFGLLNLLDADGEWYFAPANLMLSLRITGGADPTGHLVEVKRRNWCVNINGCNYIIVRGIQTIGGAIQLNGTGNVLDSCNAGHLSHFLTFSNGSKRDGGLVQGGGVILNSSGCTVQNCTIHDTAGPGIYSQGSGHLITRNTIYNTDYAGLFTGGLVLDGDGEVSTFNTIHDCGRDVIEPIGTSESILFNNLYGSGILCKDLGVIYASFNNSISTNGNRTRIAYNWIHDGAATNSPNAGIYLDNFDRNYQADHNVIWNFLSSSSMSNGIALNSPADGHALYHNTLFNCGAYNSHTYNSYSSSNTGNSGSSTYWQPTNQHLLFVAQNNLVLSNNVARLENVTNYDFRPVAGDPAINPALTIGTNTWVTTNGTIGVPSGFSYSAKTMSQTFTYSETNGQGVAVPGVNGWVTGNPDNGAYERGVVSWTAGVTGWDGLTNDPPLAITTNSATLQGVRIAVDLASTHVLVYYGSTDGGTNPAAWTTNSDLGTAVPADVISVFRPALSNLTAGATYYARFQTSNTDGIAWSAAQSFTTLVPTTYDLWTGAVNGSWDTTTLNWSNGGPTTYSDGIAVQFDDSATGSTLVTNAVTVSPGGILVTNNTQNYVISGSSIAGGGILTKSGTGTLRLKSVNTFTGSLTVSQGVLITGSDTAAGLTGVLGNPNTAGRQITVASGATLTFGNHDTFGNWTATPAVTLNISGTINNSAAVVNALGAVNFNGGTLSASSGYSGGSGIAYAFNSLSNVTVSGSSPSMISLTGGSYIGLNGVVAFNVASGASLNVAGPLKNHPASITGGLTKSGLGTLNLTATNAYTGPTTVSAGTLLVNGATGTNTVTVVAGATLGGSGTIGGAVTLGSGAFATNVVGSPLTATNGLTLNGNTMNVSTLSTLGFGDYLLITNTSVTAIGGTFAAVNVSGAGVAGTASIVTTAKAVTLHVAASAPPVFSGMSVSGTTLTLAVTNGTPNGAWILLQSTNVALPLGQWTTNSTGNYDGSGNLSTNLLNTATNPTEFYILK